MNQSTSKSSLPSPSSRSAPTPSSVEHVISVPGVTSNEAQNFAGLNVYTTCRRDALIGTISHEGGLAKRSKN